MKRIRDSGFRIQGKGKKKSPTPNSHSLSFWHPASLISTCFGIGKIPFAPGTFGSLAGVLIFCFSSMFFLISHHYHPSALNYLGPIIDFSIILFFGLWAITLYEHKSGNHDSGEIVVDEVVGQYIACAIPIIYISPEINYPDGIYLLITSFLLFRFFDIVKPGPVGWADRNVKGAWGVMLDDIIAGILAGICTAVIFLVF